MKKRILSCVLALLLLLTLLPAASLAADTEPTDPIEQLFIVLYGCSYDNEVIISDPVPVTSDYFQLPAADYYCRFSYGTADSSVPVNDITASGVVTLENAPKFGNALDTIDNLLLLKTSVVGSSTLTFTVGSEQKTQDITVSLPDYGTFHTNQYDQSVLCSPNELSYNGSELSFWFLGKDGLSAIPTVTVSFSGLFGALTPSADEDGWYDLGEWKHLLKMELLPEAERSGKNGLCVTLPSDIFSRDAWNMAFNFYNVYNGQEWADGNEQIGFVSVDFCSGRLGAQNMRQSGESWVEQGSYYSWFSFPSYGETVYGAQRIWIEYQGEKHRVTDITSDKQCYTVKKIENGTNDPLFQFTAAKLGSDTLRFTADGLEFTVDYPVNVSLPYNAFYSSGTASADTFLGGSYPHALDVTCAGADRTLWLLTESPLYALSSITLKLDGQALTPEDSTVDGISRYEYTIDGQKLLRAEWLSRADGNGNGNGLKLTILSGASSIVLPSAGRQLFISVTAHCSEDAESSTSLSSGTLCLRPDHRINYCYVNSEGNKYVANTATIRNDLRFNITSKEQSTLLAFYYCDPEAEEPTPISYDNITITPSDGVTISKMSGQDDHILLFSGWKLGTYTISCNVDGNTYSQPLFVTLPPVGLFREPVYDFAHYVINGNYERNISTETKPLTLWLLCNGGFSSDAEFTVEMDGEKLALDKNGYAALDGKQIAQFQLVPLSDGSAQYGLKITFSDGKALNALFGTSRRLNFSVYVKSERFSTRSRFQISNTDTTPSGPTAKPGDHTGTTVPGADTTITGGCVYVRIKGEEQVYSISLAHSSDSGALEPVISSFGSMFDEEAVKKNWARGDTLRLAVFTDMTESNYSEAKNMIPKLVKSASFRITDTSYEETGGFLSWNDPVAPTEEAPYYSLYYCISPASGQSGVGYISVDITLKDGVEFVEKPKDGDWEVITAPPYPSTITVQAHSRILETTTIDCAARGIVTMDALNDFLKNYTFPTGKENRIEIKLAPVAYEGILKFEGNRPTNAEAAIVSLHGTVDKESRTVTTIYGGLEIGGHLMVLSDLYVTPHPTDGTKNLTDSSSGNTIGLHATRSDALSNVDAVTFDGFDIGLDCDGIGYVCASTCVFKNCGTGIRIDSGAITQGNNNSEWNGNTFYNCGVGVDLISLPQYISPYRLRFYENNFLNSKEADIRVPADFDDTYYFYRNFFGTLPEGTKLTGSALEGATYANSNIKAGEVKAPDTVIVSPRRKYPIWFGSTPLNVNNYQPAELSSSGSGETGTGDISTQALFAAPMRAAAFSATNADKTSVLTIEMNGKTTIQNENASSLVIDDPEAFENGAAIKVVTRKDSKTVLLGTWEFTKNFGKVNGGFNGGLGNYSKGSDMISFEVTDSPALSTLTPTLTIPVPTDWKAATVTGPDGKAQYVPINTDSVTCSVTKGGLYTIQKTTPVWAYDPAITGTTFTAKLDTGMLGTDRSGLTGILAVYDASDRMLACYTESLTDTTFQTTVTAAVLNKAKTFKLFNLGGSSQPLNRSIRWDSSSIKN